MGMHPGLRMVPLLALVLAGCASKPPAYQILTPFLDTDFQTWNKPGPYTVSGQTSYKLPDGRVVTCAGESISLMPLTGYNMELSKLLDSGKGYPPNYERRAHKYDHKVMCDGDGRFSISGIPSLNWLLITRVSWQVLTDDKDDEPVVKHGWLYQEITVDGADKSITLSNDDFVADRKSRPRTR
jgi:hypothetical protein